MNGLVGSYLYVLKVRDVPMKTFFFSRKKFEFVNLGGLSSPAALNAASSYSRRSAMSAWTFQLSMAFF